MSIHRDELEALARTTDVLLAVLEPPELARRFLVHVAREFRAEAGILAVDPAGAEPLLATWNVDAGHAKPLATELLAALPGDDAPCAAWPPGAGEDVPARWPRLLATRVTPAAARDGVFALFSGRPGRLDPERDGRLFRIIARRAGVALSNAALHAEIRRQADRLAVQAEELEWIRAALERHSREIERSLAARSRFLAAASHELRTPINAIVGYNQLLHQGIYGTLTERQADIARKITSSAEQLLTLVNDVLDLSKIDAGKVEIRPSPVDLPALIRDAAAAIEIHVRAKGLHLHTEFLHTPPSLETDPARVLQILVNLLSNAVKFTPRGCITIQVQHLDEGTTSTEAAQPSCAAGEHGWVRITVRDTGIGIPSEKLDAIFGEFVQLAPPDARQEGSGLGLAISNRLARLLGGDLKVESEVGVQSAFTLFLPCPRPRH